MIDLNSFAHEVPLHPRAHQMVMQYSVIDDSKKALILLRPYQIHAIEAVQEASRRQESGYIWHTTGSGKTLTSYKVARNLLQIPAIQKTIFVVDRRDLDQQTTSSFLSYAANDVIDIDETDNTHELVKRLGGNDKRVVVTTIQKITTMMRKFEEGKYQRDAGKIKDLRVAFVVDECHRAVTPQTQKEIKAYFKTLSGMVLQGLRSLRKTNASKWETWLRPPTNSMAIACMNTPSRKPSMMERF